MGKNNVSVNGQTVVHKDSGGILNTTDVCNTFVGIAVVPIPYGNTALSEDTSKGSKSVFVNGNPIMLKDSEFSKSTGDEPGCIGGVMSGTTGGVAKFTNYSFDVMVEGQNVCRRLDTMTSNYENTGTGTLQQDNVEDGSDAEVEERIIRANVSEVNFQASIKTALDKETVNGPHWKEGGDNTDEVAEVNMQSKGAVTSSYTCSKKPVVYSIAGFNSDKCYVDVKIKVTKLKNVSGTATLVGRLGGLRMQGEFELTGEQEYSVRATIENARKGMQWYNGKIAWDLEVESADDPIVALKSTYVEVFFILDDPAPYYLNGKGANGVWAEVLRLLFKKASIRNTADHETAMKKLMRYCCWRYDLSNTVANNGQIKGVTADGASIAVNESDAEQIAEMPINLWLDRNLYREFGQENPLNVARGLQAFCGALGVKLSWVILEPKPTKDLSAAFKPLQLKAETRYTYNGESDNLFFTEDGKAGSKSINTLAHRENHASFKTANRLYKNVMDVLPPGLPRFSFCLLTSDFVDNRSDEVIESSAGGATDVLQGQGWMPEKTADYIKRAVHTALRVLRWATIIPTCLECAEQAGADEKVVKKSNEPKKMVNEGSSGEDLNLPSLD